MQEFSLKNSKKKKQAKDIHLVCVVGQRWMSVCEMDGEHLPTSLFGIDFVQSMQVAA